MRVTANSFPDRLINQLGDLASRQAKLQNQAATGQRVQLPEDDPRAMRRVLDIQAEAGRLDQFSSNIGKLQDASTASYTAIKSLKTMNDRASELATLADGLKSPEEMRIYAQEVNQILEQALQTANTKHRGDYLFAGTRVDQPPYSVTKDANGNITGVTYNGNSDSIRAEISPDVLSEGQPVGGNASGVGARGLLSDSRSGADVFNHLIELRDHLLANDKDAIANNDRANLRKDEDNFLYHYGHIGAVQSRLEAAASLTSSQSFSAEQQVSGLVDADLAQTLVRLTQTQNAYTAALQSGGSILNKSLLDYIR
jgi:flagellar hook-associated protein 3 FlgL